MAPEPDDPAPASTRPDRAARSDRAGRSTSLLERLRGPWRVTVAEASMLPAIAPGDWLLVDPTTRRWPRNGAIVVFREPETDDLAIKRVRAGAGERVPFNGGYIVIGDDEAWLEADASVAAAAAVGFGPPIDSNRFGPVPVDQLIGRVWFRYGPLRRIGRLRSRR